MCEKLITFSSSTVSTIARFGTPAEKNKDEEIDYKLYTSCTKEWLKLFIIVIMSRMLNQKGDRNLLSTCLTDISEGKMFTCLTEASVGKMFHDL